MGLYQEYIINGVPKVDVDDVMCRVDIEISGLAEEGFLGGYSRVQVKQVN